MRDFRKGDKVWDVRYGKGVVTGEKASPHFPISVSFEREGVAPCYYMYDGSFAKDQNRSLFHGHSVQIIGEEIPDRKRAVAVPDELIVSYYVDKENDKFTEFEIDLPEDLADSFEKYTATIENTVNK